VVDFSTTKKHSPTIDLDFSTLDVVAAQVIDS
jgi:hypothetical protein